MDSRVINRLRSDNAADPGSGANPSVLIVDDDRFIRDFLQRYLPLQGFRIHVAADGEEALRLYRAHAEDIDIVLLDVRMPAMDGPTTLSALQEVNPLVRTCFMSGDIGEYTINDLQQIGALQLFEKPLQLEHLARTLKQLAMSHTE